MMVIITIAREMLLGQPENKNPVFWWSPAEINLDL